MHTSSLLFVGFSVLTLFDGVIAQGRGRGGNAAGAGTSAAATTTAAVAAAAAATTTAAAAAANAVQSGINAAIASASTASEAPPPAASLQLSAANLQADSNSNGGPTNGQAPSLTDDANFINFCSGKLLTNGLQFSQGSCNGIPMGDIPPLANVISTVIQQPTNGENLQPNQPFNVVIQTNNLQAGQFTNPDNTYYAAPQHLNAQKQIIGHVHITIQDMNANGGADGKVPPDGGKFAFFKGIDDAGNGAGQLTAVVTNGLPAGASYRICTLVAAANHQPVIMPLAQRGAQDDCIRITVGQNGAGAGAAAAAAPAASQPAAANANTAAAAAASVTASQPAAAVSQPAAANSNAAAANNGGRNRGGAANSVVAVSQSAAVSQPAAAASTNTVAANNGGRAGAASSVVAAAPSSTAATTTAAAAGSQGTAPPTGPARSGRGGRGRAMKRFNRIEAEPRRRFAARELIV